ncbi:MAG: tetratricopeptide repeat protein [Chloroflexi bacterium]|nr:tetratricopeptide repeat protein [Chloroflexota bacterium]
MVLGIGLALSGCRQAAPQPTPTQAIEEAATIPAEAAAPATETPTPTVYRTATVAPTPISSSTPTAAPTMAATAEPSTAVAEPTAMSSETPAPTDPPAPTEAPTHTTAPSPASEAGPHLVAAKRAHMDGDYPRAIPLWQSALEANSETSRPAIALELAQAYYEEQRYQEAIALLALLVEDGASDAELARAYALLGNCYEAIDEWQAAISAYASYLEFDAAALPYVRWHMAKAYEALGNDAHMEAQLTAIDLTSIPASMQAEVLEEIAEVRRRRQNYDGAVEAYNRILGFSQNATYRALILRYQGETLEEAGRTAEAAAVYQRLLRDYPSSSHAVTALAALDKMGAAQIDDLERGRILYYGWQYGQAIEALERYIEANPGGNMPRAHYFAGLAYEKLGQYGEALRYLDVIIEQFPQDALAGDAWMAKARVAEANGGDPSGLYQEFVRLYPNHARVPEALWEAGQALERQREWARAAEMYHRLRLSYPADSGAFEGHFREGLCAYISGDAGTAYAVWRDQLPGANTGEQQARVHTWMGLAARATGDSAKAQEHWQQAQAASPWSYYGARARDLAAGVAPVLPTTHAAAPEEPAWTQADWDQIAAWMASWTPNTTGALNESLLNRARALDTLGWHTEATATYREVWNQAWSNAGSVFRLARLMVESGHRWLAISCADRLISLGEQAGAAEPPQALLRLSYPTLFSHLVNAECADRTLDPLLFLALVRQESRFDPRAVSYAGATGLTQVMPATGQEIAAKLGVAPFRVPLLTRPAISVRFGVFYFGWLIDYRDRDWVAALVGYNAGPGNLTKWTDGQPIADHDLFYETVLYGQAKSYVTSIYAQYRRYEDIYR